MNIYEELTRIAKENPELIFDNNGYEYLSKETKLKHKEVIDEITQMMKAHDRGFSRFDNFKPRKNGSLELRYQAVWDRNNGFIGVVYTPLENFKENTSC